METIEAKSRTRPQDWVLPAIFAALVIGLLVGVWSQRSRIESGDLVGIVSVVGSIAIALYTVASNRETMRDQRSHDLEMQAQEFREGRSRLHREDAVSRVIEIRRTLAPATPFTLDFFDFAQNPIANDDEQTTRNKEKIYAAIEAVAKGRWEVDWFTLIGWTEEIQQRAEEADTVMGDLLTAWGVVLDSYYRVGITDPTALQDRVKEPWDRVEVAVNALREELRAELARKPLA